MLFALIVTAGTGRIADRLEGLGVTGSTVVAYRIPVGGEQGPGRPQTVCAPALIPSVVHGCDQVGPGQLIRGSGAAEIR